jgi:hypothetical protein
MSVIPYSPYTMSLSAESTIYQFEIRCHVQENDFNYTLNPSALKKPAYVEPIPLVISPSVTPTATPTISITATPTPSLGASQSPTPTISITPTSTISVTPTLTPTLTPTPTRANFLTFANLQHAFPNTSSFTNKSINLYAKIISSSYYSASGDLPFVQNNIQVTINCDGSGDCVRSNQIGNVSLGRLSTSSIYTADTIIEFGASEYDTTSPPSPPPVPYTRNWELRMSPTNLFFTPVTVVASGTDVLDNFTYRYSGVAADIATYGNNVHYRFVYDV